VRFRAAEREAGRSGGHFLARFAELSDQQLGRPLVSFLTLRGPNWRRSSAQTPAEVAPSEGRQSRGRDCSGRGMGGQWLQLESAGSLLRPHLIQQEAGATWTGKNWQQTTAGGEKFIEHTDGHP